MVLNAAVQAMRQADELKQKVQKQKGNDAILQDRTLWLTQQELQKVYQRILVLDLDYALDKKVEQDLWTIGFKHQIEALQAISKDRKNPRRSEGQAMLTWVLQSAAGFYLCLLHQICTTFKLDLPFRRRASIFGEVVSWGVSGARLVGTGEGASRRPAPASCRYICQHCLVHLGDLARYRHQLRVADSFYRHALAVSTSSGQPYNQLALLEASRGDRLAALYFHVRSLAVRAPFPPARGNLARTLAAAALPAPPRRDRDRGPDAISDADKNSERESLASPPISSLLSGEKISPHQYITELIRFHHLLKTNERLDIASHLVSSLTSTLTALVGTDSFDSATIVKMTCINMFAATGGLHESEELPKEDPRRLLALQLAGGQLAALLLPARSPLLNYVGLPSVKILLEWVKQSPSLLSEPAFVSRLQLWPALCKVLNDLQTELGEFNSENYSTLPLPEDEELHGFLPIDKAFIDLKFTNLATPDAFGYDIKKKIYLQKEEKASILKNDHTASKKSCGDLIMPNERLKSNPEIMNKLRASRIVGLGKLIADSQAQQKCQFFTFSVTDNLTTFLHVENALESNPELLKAIEMLKIVPETQIVKNTSGEISDNSLSNSDEKKEDGSDTNSSSADIKIPLIKPVVISEADFREKVRERRVGILKPQGSLERAREERALASTVPSLTENNVTCDVPEPSSTSLTSEKDEDTPSKKEGKRGRMNVAMQAIMRKQEEISKQVKFITPASTPESTTETQETLQKDDEKMKIIQPKAIKSLTNLPLDRKTGGILSLKDKSAGYPHLVKVETSEKAEQQEIVATEASAPKNPPQKQETHTMFGYQYPNFVPKEAKAPMPAQQQIWSDPQFQTPKSQYSIFNQKPLNAQVGYGTGNNAQGGLRLPVVNPKEIDVRSAALQKQHSRSDQLFGSETRAGGGIGVGMGMNHNPHWQGDKLLFMNDLPPRFANQFRNNNQANNMTNNSMNNSMSNGWPSRDNPQEMDRKYGDPGFPGQVNMGSWDPPPVVSETPPQPPSSWWKPNLGSNFDPNYPTGDMQSPSYYMQGTNNLYQNLNSYGNTAPYSPGYPSATPSLQNLISSPNFTATLNNFNYGQNQQPPVAYDPTMYPQFSGAPKLGYQNKSLNDMHKPPASVNQPQYPFTMSGLSHDRDAGMMGNDSMSGNRMSPSIPMPDYGNSPSTGFMAGLGTMQDMKSGSMPENSQHSNSYSLFSGGQDNPPWGSATFRNPSGSGISLQQSIWSGPGPLALERLLEQQKQLKQNPE